MALNGRGDTHQICPLLKVNRPCHLAAVTAHIDPKQTSAPWPNRLRETIACVSWYSARSEEGAAYVSDLGRTGHG
jgi:hypothetical protein